MDNKRLNHKNLRTAAMLLLIAFFLIRMWIDNISYNYVYNWRHIMAVVLFLPLPILFFKNYKATVYGIIIYLAIGVVQGLSVMAGTSSMSITLFWIPISGFNGPCLGLLMLHCLLHIDILINMYLDKKELKANEVREQKLRDKAAKLEDQEQQL